MQNQTVAEISLSAIEHNCRRLGEIASPASVIPVVKTDAYGHGAVAVARHLEKVGATTFAVVTLNEAIELRDADLAGDIVVMGAVDPARIGEAVQRGITVTIHDVDNARAYLDRARQARSRLTCHMKVDTGMHRWGVPWKEAAGLLAELSPARELQVTGLMTHLARVEEADLAPTQSQLRAMRELVAELTARRLRPRMVHVANSGATLRCADARYDAVRPGLALYGLSPCPELTPAADLRPAMEVRSVIALVKEVDTGRGISYGHTWRARRPARIAILPIGYADGYPRSMSNRAVVRINGKLAPVAGNVCMDATLVDVTEIPEATVGSAVTLIEADDASPLSVRAVATLAGTIPHEIMTRIGHRVRRVYVGP